MMFDSRFGESVERSLQQRKHWAIPPDVQGPQCGFLLFSEILEQNDIVAQKHKLCQVYPSNTTTFGEY